MLADSLDHLVGEVEQRRGDFEAERPGGLEIDHQFELGGLHHRKIGRLFALENSTDVQAGLAIEVCNAGSIAHQAPCHRILAQCIDCRYCMMRGQCDDLIALTFENRIGAYKKRVRPCLRQRLKRRIKIPLATGAQHSHLPSERARCLLCGRYFGLVGGTGRVHKNRNRLDSGNQIAQQNQPASIRSD